MDPSVYARAFGVQSEANSHTVTRVACGEILYRRVVDTFRKDMRSKLTSLRKEQKRLRKSIRGYRQKLRESHHSQLEAPIKEKKRHGNLESHSSNVEIYIHTDESMAISNTATATQPEAAEKDNGNRKTKSQSVLVSGVEKMQNDDRQNVEIKLSNALVYQEDCRDLNNIKKIHNGASEALMAAPNSNTHMLENVGRIRRIGSGKIGAKSRQAHESIAEDEMDEDNLSVLSDSSGEDGAGKRHETPNEVVTFQNGRFVREVTPMTLIRVNSAYFTPVPGAINGDSNEPDENKNGVGVRDEKPSTDDISGQFQKEVTDRILKQSKPTNNNTVVFPRPSVVTDFKLSHPRDSTSKSTYNLAPINSKTARKKPRDSEVSFNDLMKLQVGNNTKKLFQLVDRLARLNGIPVTDENPNRGGKKVLEKRDPREELAILRRSRAARTNGQSFTTYGSVCYAIKFGYVSDPEPEVQPHKILRHTSDKDDSIHYPLTNTASLLMKKPFITSDMSALTETMSDLSLSQESKSPTMPSASSNMNVTEACPGMADNSGSENKFLSFTSDLRENQRYERKRSILEASNYMSMKRRRSSILGSSSRSVEQVRKEKEILQRKRRDSTLPEHVEVPQTHKESWQSAFRRIKILHTLLDINDLV